MSDQNKDVELKERREQEQALREQTLDGVVSCRVCLKEIPQSIARTEEGDDYILYFCGRDCFDAWEHQKK